MIATLWERIHRSWSRSTPEAAMNTYRMLKRAFLFICVSSPSTGARPGGWLEVYVRIPAARPSRMG
jgi:hypothetical protein